MNNKVKYIIYIIVFIVTIVVLNIGYEVLVRKQQTTEKQVTVTTEKQYRLASDVKVYDKEGNIVKLSDFKGKPIVVNFWASWCGPCQSEMPDFQNVYDKQKEEVTFLMINATDGVQETKQKAINFITDKKYTFPVYFDQDLDAINTYGITGFPTTIFINKEFQVVATYQSRMSAEKLMQYINKIK